MYAGCTDYQLAKEKNESIKGTVEYEDMSGE